MNANGTIPSLVFLPKHDDAIIRPAQAAVDGALGGNKTMYRAISDFVDANMMWPASSRTCPTMAALFDLRVNGTGKSSSAVAEAAKAVTASATALAAPQGGDAYKLAADNNSDFTEYFAMLFTALAFTAAFFYLWRKRHY